MINTRYKKFNFSLGFGSAVLLLIAIIFTLTRVNAASVEPKYADSSTQTTQQQPVPEETSHIDFQSLENSLPKFSEDRVEILSSIRLIAQAEVELINNLIKEEDGWYYTAYQYEIPQSARSGNIWTDIPASSLIPENPLVENYLRVDADNKVLAAISILRDKVSKQITQVSIWNGQAWINISQRSAGLPEEQYTTYTIPTPTLFSQMQFDKLIKSLGNSNVDISAEKVGEQYIVRTSHNFEKPNSSIASVTGTVIQIEDIKVFNAFTGKLISSSTHAVLENNDKVLLGRDTIIAQQIINSIPADVQQLFDQYGFPTK